MVGVAALATGAWWNTRCYWNDEMILLDLKKIKLWWTTWW